MLSCLEFIEPHPEQAMQRMAAQGLRRVVVMPYLLGQGKHATLELDEVLDGLRAKSPGVQLYLTSGLGADPRLADMVVDRIHCLGDLWSQRGMSGGSKYHTAGVLLVKAGTKSQYDDCQWLEGLGQMVEARLGPGYAVAVAQSHYGDPTMEAATAHLVQERRVSSLVCVPYLFFPGLILRRNILGGLEQLKHQYPHLPIAVTPPLGVDDRLVAVAADRIREVWEMEDTTQLGSGD
jgi:sirohydrochlorin ferrochelatase